MDASAPDASSDGVLPAAEAQPAIIMATSPRVVIAVVVRILFTVRLLMSAVQGGCRAGSGPRDAGGESRAVGRMDDEERAPVTARVIRLEREIGRQAQPRTADVVRVQPLGLDV